MDILNSSITAGVRTQQRYSPLVEALAQYSDNGWVIHVFPWVVGIRGMVDPQSINALLGFLEIPKKHWQAAVERTVLASVRALYFLHRVRFGGLSAGRRTVSELSLRSGEGSDEDCNDMVDLQTTLPSSLVGSGKR